ASAAAGITTVAQAGLSATTWNCRPACGTTTCAWPDRLARPSALLDAPGNRPAGQQPAERAGRAHRAEHDQHTLTGLADQPQAAQRNHRHDRGLVKGTQQPLHDKWSHFSNPSQGLTWQK